MTASPPNSTAGAFAGRLFPLVAVVFCGVLSIGIPLPALPLHVHDGLGFAPVFVGIAVGTQSLVTVLTRGFTGGVVDRHGAKAAVLIGLPLAALAGLIYLASLALPDPVLSFAILLAGRVVLGLGESFFITGGLTWAVGRAGVSNTGPAMAWNGIAIYAALAAGAPLGVLMQSRFGFGWTSVVSVVAPLIGFAIALFVPKVPPVAGRRLPLYKVVGLIWRQGTVLALSVAPFALIGSFVVLAFAERGWDGAGFALTLFGASLVVVRLFFAHLPDRFGGVKVAAISLLVEGVGQALLWLAPSPALALVGAGLTGAGFSLVFPAMGVEAVRRVPPESRGLALGGFVAFLDVALGVTGPLAGLLIAHTGYSAAFLSGAIICLAALAMVLDLRRR